MKRIVIVDDDPGVQESYRLIFDHEKYEVDIYFSGKAILGQEVAVADLYLLDKQLSGIDGLDVCRFLKSNEQTRNAPVIILSASPRIQHLAREAGADDALEKPFKVKELRAMVDRLVH